MAAEPISTTKTKHHAPKDSAIKDWLDQYWPNLAVLPYFAVVWAFTTYVGEIATPWTIGYLILWLIYAPIATWSGVFMIGGAFRFTVACLVALVVAIPFWPDAIWMCVTIFAAFILGGSPHLWIAVASFVAIVCGIYIWSTGGIGL